MDLIDFSPIKAAVNVNHALDGESKTGYIIAVCSVSIVLTTIAVLARLYTRLWVLHTFGRDDFVMAMAQIFTILTAVSILLGWCSLSLSCPWMIYTIGYANTRTFLLE